MPPSLLARALLASVQLSTAQRWWLERLAFVIPSPEATRWLLVADAVCLVVLGLSWERPLLAVPLALGTGFLVLNVFGMGLTDFYLGLALFHFTVGIGTATLARRTRWLGVAQLVLVLVLGWAT